MPSGCGAWPALEAPVPPVGLSGGGWGTKLKGRVQGTRSELPPAPRDGAQGPHVATPAPRARQHGRPQSPFPELRARGLLVPWGLANAAGGPGSAVPRTCGELAWYGHQEVAAASGHPAPPSPQGTLSDTSGSPSGRILWSPPAILVPGFASAVLPPLGALQRGACPVPGLSSRAGPFCPPPVGTQECSDESCRHRELQAYFIQSH